MSQNDQPRPDLDAAIDAVVPALTAVSDDAAAASLRRTRTVVAEARGTSSFGGWRWAVPAAAMVVAALAAFLWWPVAQVEGPRVAIVDGRPPAPPGPLIAKASPLAAVVPAPSTVRPTRLARTVRIEATSAPRADETLRPDPLDALVRAVQAIPEDAWRASVARADTPLTVPDIDLAPIDTPPVGDVLVEPIAPGEP